MRANIYTNSHIDSTIDVTDEYKVNGHIYECDIPFDEFINR